MSRRLSLLLGLSVLAALACVCLGPVSIGPGTVARVLASHAGLAEPAGVRDDTIIWAIRLPRTLLAFGVGGGLGLAGAGLQGLFRNPLVEPSLIGVSAGAAVGAVLCIALLPVSTGWVAAFAVPIAATVGAAAMTLIVYRLAHRDGETPVGTLLLAGIAVNALAGAVIGFVLTVVDDVALRSITLWTLGSVGGATWRSGLVVAASLMFALLLILPRARSLDALLLGEHDASHLGVDVERLKDRLVLGSTLAVGAATAFAGLLGFVGLVIPHILRLLWGPGHRLLLPASAVAGGMLLATADVVARTAVAPSEMPLGVLTAVLGAPFFLFLLRREGLAL